MSKKKISADSRLPAYPHRVVKQQLRHLSVELTSFFFRYGANIYVFSYGKESEKRHTFIDTGYTSHRNQIFPILTENGINLNNVERIIITHRHSDHCGLAGLLASQSGGKIIAHSNFKDFVDGNISREERKWLGGFDPSHLKSCDMEYLDQSDISGSINIGGVDFPCMGKPIEVGNGCRLEIFTCPESDPTHSPDQLIVLYSPRGHPYTPYTGENTDENFRPTDEIIFSGDLWLMKGPIFERSLRNFKHNLRFIFYRLMNRLSGSNALRRDPREQDAEAKEALKQGFCLINVKPGHGEEFLGSNIIPKTLFADRDLLVKLGFSIDQGKAILRSRSLASKVTELREKAYFSFVDELHLWMKMGYSLSEISGLLVRIYQEQSGGGQVVEEDRKERRERLKETLIRLREDRAESEDIHQIAGFALSAL